MNKMLKKTIIGTLLIVSIGVAISIVPNVGAVTITPTPTTTPRAGNRADTIRAALLTRAKELATALFNNQYLAKLNELRSRVSSNADLGSDAKAAILAKIDTELLWFTEKRDSLANASTVDQVRNTVKEARARFLVLAKEVRRLHIAKGFVIALDNVITNLETNIVTKIESKLTELQNKGTDVSSEQVLLSSAKTEIAAAKTKVLETRNSTTLELAKANYTAAKGHLKNARATLKNLLVSLKTKV